MVSVKSGAGLLTTATTGAADWVANAAEAVASADCVLIAGEPEMLGDCACIVFGKTRQPKLNNRVSIKSLYFTTVLYTFIGCPDQIKISMIR